MKIFLTFLILLIIFVGLQYLDIINKINLPWSNNVDLPTGETVVVSPTPIEPTVTPSDLSPTPQTPSGEPQTSLEVDDSSETIFETDGVRHIVPLDEILSGGPPKDGIPSIDEPKYVSTNQANDWLDDDHDLGQGLCIGQECRFYPYQILVWHEIVNDNFGDTPALVTYCPLCQTGIVFDPEVNGTVFEFGTSGMLWKSNLVMYNRTGNEDTESLWSQVLGKAIVGQDSGTQLKIIPSDVVTYGEWKVAHPDTVVLSRDTGHTRSYGRDPYGDYYTNDDVGFGATFDDNRLHPKAYVLGININDKFKAYHDDALSVGTTTDTFNGATITITKSATGQVRMKRDGQDLPYIGGFWFSWLAVHEETELYK